MRVCLCPPNSVRILPRCYTNCYRIGIECQFFCPSPALPSSDDTQTSKLRDWRPGVPRLRAVSRCQVSSRYSSSTSSDSVAFGYTHVAVHTPPVARRHQADRCRLCAAQRATWLCTRRVHPIHAQLSSDAIPSTSRRTSCIKAKHSSDPISERRNPILCRQARAQQIPTVTANPHLVRRRGPRTCPASISTATTVPIRVGPMVVKGRTRGHGRCRERGASAIYAVELPTPHSQGGARCSRHRTSTESWR